MAENEERILIARSTDYTITDTAEGALFDGKIAPHCANVMTRQEAIKRIAKAICKISCACKYYSCGNCTEFLEHYTPDLAEAALNSLLEEQK